MKIMKFLTIILLASSLFHFKHAFSNTTGSENHGNRNSDFLTEDSAYTKSLEEQIKSLEVQLNLIKNNDLRHINENVSKLSNQHTLIDERVTMNAGQSNNLVSFFSWITGGFIGISALILASGIFYVVNENRNIKKESKKIRSKSRKAILKLQDEATTKITNMERKGIEHMRFQVDAYLLRLHIENKPYDLDEIYSKLQSIINSNSSEFHPLIAKVEKLNISTDISQLAGSALPKS